MSEPTDPNTVQVLRSQADLWQRSTALLDRMLGDPVDAPAVEAIIAKHNPQAQFPARAAREAITTPLMGEVDKVRAETAAQLETERTARTELQARLDKREADELAAAQRAQDSALTDQINAIKTRRGFSDETMERVLNRMRETNNPDVDSAAAWVAESIPKPLPATGHDYLPSQVDVYGGITDDANKAWDGLRQDPTKWQTQELRDIVRDPEFLRLGQQ